MIDTNATLADLAVHHPVATRVFLRHRLDFCCGGDRPLAQACKAAAIDPNEVVKEIQAESERLGGDLEVWAERPLADLIDFIIARYHVPLRRDLPDLVALARKVEHRHADKESCPRGLGDLLEGIQAEVASHLEKEEQILFPIVKAGRGPDAGMPIRVMELEHDQHGANLRRIRELTGDLVLPREACRSWTALYDGLTRLEAELMEHIHLENNVLFPRALAE
ncbi:MAG TPA: iron-sulfur cluster repair protein YtfE [Anaeromyxobacter sp.]|nr:iron-sulfur cluster repair protein YtfE [Anaeromyxobacter sp.]